MPFLIFFCFALDLLILWFLFLFEITAGKKNHFVTKRESVLKSKKASDPEGMKQGFRQSKSTKYPRIRDY